MPPPQPLQGLAPCLSCCSCLAQACQAHGAWAGDHLGPVQRSRKLSLGGPRRSTHDVDTAAASESLSADNLSGSIACTVVSEEVALPKHNTYLHHVFCTFGNSALLVHQWGWGCLWWDRWESTSQLQVLRLRPAGPPRIARRAYDALLHRSPVCVLRVNLPAHRWWCTPLTLEASPQGSCTGELHRGTALGSP